MRKTAAILILAAALAAVAYADNGRAVDGVVSIGSGANDAAEHWAVVIGVGDYTDPGISDLPNAVNDAKAVYRALVSESGLFPADNVILMTDGAANPMHRPTRNNILSQVGNWVELADKNDAVFIYFAGHGYDHDGKLYLMPLDAHTSRVGLTGIPYQAFEGELDRAGARLSLVVLDACHSGTGRGDHAMTRGMLDDFLAASEGRILLASCKEEEMSHEMPGKGHGAFTHFFLEGLSGAADGDADGLVTAKELSNYTYEGVSRWSRRAGVKQTPRLKADISGDFLLAKVTTVQGKTKEPSVSIVTPKPKAPEPGEVRVFEGGEMAWCPPGRFLMGSKLSPERVVATYGGEEKYFTDEHPRHEVRLTDGFWLGTKEVTNGEFEAFVKATGHTTDAEKAGKAWGFDLKAGKWCEQKGLSWRKPGWDTKRNEPVVCVSWNDAVAYCQWLSGKSGATYRLPTDAEWEYACRAGTTTVFFWGDRAKDGKGYLNGADETKLPNGKQWSHAFPFSDGYWRTAPVGSFLPNAWGLYDMHGNAYEWCADWYGDHPSGSVTDPKGPNSDKYRVVRGGGWGNNPSYCRAATRSFLTPGVTDGSLGFRVARTP